VNLAYRSAAINHSSGKQPDQVRFLEIGFDTRGAGISLGMRRMGWSAVNGWDGADAVIKASMAIGAASSRNPFPNPSNGNHHVDDFNRHRRDRSCLSLRVPAHGGSGNLEKSNMCLFVIRLASGGANGNTNWRYARNFSPFTGDTAIANVQDIFSDAALLDYQDGQLKRIVPSAEEILPGSASDPIAYYPATQWACYLFDCTAARAQGTDYLYRYNIHVEIMDRARQNFISLIIDPDVGFPGGSGP
jgi:hypothetical protein